MVSKNTICLWYDGTALDAARFYAETFPDSAVRRVHRAPGDYPSGKEGDVLTVEFSVMGIPCLGLNGGPLHIQNKIAPRAKVPRLDDDRVAVLNPILCSTFSPRRGDSERFSPSVVQISPGVEPLTHPEAGHTALCPASP